MQDIIIRNGRIVDGTGHAAYTGGIAIKDGIITAVGQVDDLHACREIDAKGLVIAPGFFDAHCHSDITFVQFDACEARIYQGVTTEVCGQCGDSCYPSLEEKLHNISAKREVNGIIEDWSAPSFDHFLRRVDAMNRPMATNLCQLIGHGTLRAGVMDYDDRAPSKEELETMKHLLARDLERGAWGLSLGLEYSPGCFSKQEELFELAKVVKDYDGFITAHMRDEGVRIFEAIDEILAIGRETGVRVHISHLKIDRPVNWGRAAEVWQKLEAARQEGIRVSADMYPYTASCTGITNRCPKWAIEGGSEAAAKFLQGERRQEIIDHLKLRFPDRMWAERCLVTTTYGLFPEAEGKNLHELAELLQLPYELAAAELIVRSKGQAVCIFFVMDEQDVDYFLRQDIGICSDGYGHPFDAEKLHGERPHPRSFGAIDRFLRLARENKLCSLEEAVRRVTSKAADMVGLKDRGRLAVGLAADVTVFDPDTICDRATYTEPFQKPTGIELVIVNGEIALENGQQTAARAGKFLLHQ